MMMICLEMGDPITLQNPNRHCPFFSKLNEDEVDMLLDLEDEASRCNRFERIFPVPSTMDYYSQFFEVWFFIQNIMPQFCLVFALSPETDFSTRLCSSQFGSGDAFSFFFKVA